MAYERAIPIVDITAKLLSSALSSPAQSLMPGLIRNHTQHGTAPGTAIVLINRAPRKRQTARALKRYLPCSSLSDPRRRDPASGVVADPERHHPQHPPEKSRRNMPLSGRRRARRSKVHTERQSKFLAGYLGERGHHVTVAWAMR